MTLSDLEDPDFLDLLPSGLLPPWYLIFAFAYYEAETSLVPDHVFDQLARRLDQEWDSVQHMHKRLIDRAALKSGGSYLRGRYPMRVKQAAALLLGRPVFDR